MTSRVKEIKARPVNLDLTKFRFPPMALVSIGHRISGVFLFIFLPFLFYLLSQSLRSPQSFLETQILLRNPWIKFLVWFVLCSAVFHLIAGIRHLLLDMGWGESLSSSRASAYGVFLLTAVCFIGIGVWLC